jgi:methyl-accepting chemotaxis protein
MSTLSEFASTAATGPGAGESPPGWWGRLRAALGWSGAAAPMATNDAAQALAARLAEAASTWTTHLGTAQSQMRDATQELLQGFVGILDDLDAILQPGGDSGPGLDARTLDARVVMLQHCEEQLGGLLQTFQGFVASRDQVVGSVRSLTTASGSLSQMAEDVAKLARQTNLLSVNAAIEAARAGPSGRGFSVVAAEVRRLSTESGDTGKRISDQVHAFSSQMQQALSQASAHSVRDAQALKASEATITDVVQQVDTTVSALNERATQLKARSEAVKAQVENLMVAFQFQDRVHQIMDQVNASILSGTDRLQQALLSGTVPSQAEWTALLSEGYTTAEQRAVGSGGAGSASAASATSDTTFF